ncbi:hypothetical protein L0U88_20670, partial [Flavihumibacter sp. RY-1]
TIPQAICYFLLQSRPSHYVLQYVGYIPCLIENLGVKYNCMQRKRLGDVAVFENRQPVTADKFITNSSLFILLLGVIRWLELKPISEQKVEHIFVAPPYCQTACCTPLLSVNL